MIDDRGWSRREGEREREREREKYGSSSPPDESRTGGEGNGNGRSGDPVDAGGLKNGGGGELGKDGR